MAQKNQKNGAGYGGQNQAPYGIYDDQNESKYGQEGSSGGNGFAGTGMTGGKANLKQHQIKMAKQARVKNTSEEMQGLASQNPVNYNMNSGYDNQFALGGLNNGFNNNVSKEDNDFYESLNFGGGGGEGFSSTQKGTRKQQPSANESLSKATKNMAQPQSQQVSRKNSQNEIEGLDQIDLGDQAKKKKGKRVIKKVIKKKNGESEPPQEEQKIPFSTASSSMVQQEQESGEPVKKGKKVIKIVKKKKPAKAQEQEKEADLDNIEVKDPQQVGLDGQLYEKSEVIQYKQFVLQQQQQKLMYEQQQQLQQHLEEQQQLLKEQKDFTHKQLQKLEEEKKKKLEPNEEDEDKQQLPMGKINPKKEKIIQQKMKQQEEEQKRLEMQRQEERARKKKKRQEEEEDEDEDDEDDEEEEEDIDRRNKRKKPTQEQNRQRAKSTVAKGGGQDNRTKIDNKRGKKKRDESEESDTSGEEEESEDESDEDRNEAEGSDDDEPRQKKGGQKTGQLTAEQEKLRQQQLIGNRPISFKVAVCDQECYNAFLHQLVFGQKSRELIMNPIPHQVGLLKFTIERHRTGFNRLHPSYYFYLEKNQGGRVLVLYAKKRAFNKTANYLISMEKNKKDRGNDICMGKLRANSEGDKYVLFDNGENYTKVHQFPLDKIRNEQGAFIYRYEPCNVGNIRKMIVALPILVQQQTNINTGPDGIHALAYDSTGKAVIMTQKLWKPIREQDTILEVFTREGIRNNNYQIFVDNPPSWNPKTNTYVYDFKGRVTKPSIKNFQLIPELDGRRGQTLQDFILQFGKNGKDQFICDVQYPFSIYQSFGLALSAFDTD